MSDSVDELIAPPRTHNQPPDPIAELQTGLAQTQKPLLTRRDELIASFGRAPETVGDNATADKVADLIKLIAACEKNTEAARVAVKEPYLAAGRAVDGFFKAITDPLTKAKKALGDRLTIWQRKVAEDERRRREEEAARQRAEEERKRQEAEAKAAAMKSEADLNAAIEAERAAQQAAANAAAAEEAAAAKPADLSRSRSAIGSVASLHRFWDFKDLDRAAVNLEALRPYLAIADIEKAVRAFIRAGGRELTGVTIFENTETRVK